jgi:polyketide biosynthesis enoyl-CoA hydratase PksH
MELTMKPVVITLPERLDGSFLEAARARLATIADVPAVVLDGAPGCFCLGMDHAAASAAGKGEAGRSEVRRGLEAYARCLELLLGSPRPTCAVVDGPALGGGLGLAAACDFVLATERARFGLPEGLYGLAPSIIRPALLTRLSAQQVNLLLFTCYSRSAGEAAALGLVDRVVPVEQVESARRETARQLRRVRSETVIASRQWNAGEIERGLRAGVEETFAALSNESILTALRAAVSEDALLWSR